MIVHRKESIINVRFRAMLPHPQLNIRRIENSVDPGMPDIVLTFLGITYFVEAKVGVDRVNSYPAVKFRKAQIPWIEGWSRSGGNVCVIVVTSDGVLHAVAPRDARQVGEEGLRPSLITASVIPPLNTRGLLRLLGACQYGPHVQAFRPIKVELPQERNPGAPKRLARKKRPSIERGALLPFVP